MSPKDIDQLCNESEKVKISIESYHTEKHNDGNSEQVLDSFWRVEIQSSKDFLSFDVDTDGNKEMNTLSKEMKKELR